ncbi:MAG: hypothetical protein ACOCW6_08460 [Spirochaetota bacterium]
MEQQLGGAVELIHGPQGYRIAFPVPEPDSLHAPPHVPTGRPAMLVW